jgi:hypothetical protein
MRVASPARGARHGSAPLLPFRRCPNQTTPSPLAAQHSTRATSFAPQLIASPLPYRAVTRPASSLTTHSVAVCHIQPHWIPPRDDSAARPNAVSGLGLLGQHAVTVARLTPSVVTIVVAGSPLVCSPRRLRHQLARRIGPSRHLTAFLARLACRTHTSWGVDPCHLVAMPGSAERRTHPPRIR